MKCKKRTDDSEPNRKKLCLVTIAGFLMLVLPIVSLILDSQYLIMIYMTRISAGTKIYNILVRENAATLIQVYVFNVTNADAFLSGEEQKLRVEEVGPFTYQEFRKNENFEVDEEAGVMRYTPMTRTEFRPEHSISDPSLINITVPNTAMLAMSSMLSSYPFWTKGAFTMLASRMQSQPIINIDVNSFLWGYDEPLITLGNTILPGWITFSKMGILDRLYDQSSNPTLEVSIASEDKFEVKKVDGCPGLKMWEYENPSKRTRCNTLVNAYEGYAYKPKLNRDDSIRLYRNTFCRMLDLDYNSTTSTDISPEAFVYRISNTSYSIGPKTECLCGQMKECFNGITDASPCFYGLSIALSNGHFLNGDPKIYERVDGIHPDESIHGSEFVIDPTVGAVLSGKFSLQVNVLVKDVSFFHKVKHFSNMAVPLVYFKIVQPELEDNAKSDIKMSYTLYPYILHGLEAIVFLTGLFILTYAARKIYWYWFCSYTEPETKTQFLEEALMDENNHITILGKSDQDIYVLES